MNEQNQTMDGFADDCLVGLAKEGDVNAFAELVRRYQQKIYQTIFQLTRNHHDTDDLAQDTFMKAFKSLREFKQRSSFYTWLYRIAVNLTLNFLKKRYREKNKESYTENHSSAEDRNSRIPSPEDYSLKKELKEKLKDALDSLPLAYKASFILVTFQGMSHSQAAEVLDCSEKTVSWRLHKARKILQEKLKPYV